MAFFVPRAMLGPVRPVKPTRPKSPESSPDAVARWIRERRGEMGLSVTALAEAVGVSQAYVSLIETGARRPSEEVAAALARELQIPPDALRAWVRVFNPSDKGEQLRAELEVADHLPEHLQGDWLSHLTLGDLAEELEAGLSPRAIGSMPPSSRIRGVMKSRFTEEDPLALGALEQTIDRHVHEALLSLQESGLGRPPRELDHTLVVSILREIRSRDPELFRQMIAELAPNLSADADVVEVPVDPPQEATAPVAVASASARFDARADSILLDGRLLPGTAGIEGAVALRAGADEIERVKDTLQAGDLLIVSPECWPLVAGEIYRVRFEARTVLTRLALKGNTLILLSSDPGDDVHLIPVKDERRKPDGLMGRVAVVIRNLSGR